MYMYLKYVVHNALGYLGSGVIFNAEINESDIKKKNRKFES